MLVWPNWKYIFLQSCRSSFATCNVRGARPNTVWKLFWSRFFLFEKIPSEGSTALYTAYTALLTLFTLLSWQLAKQIQTDSWLLVCDCHPQYLHYSPTLMKRRALLGSLIVKARFYWRGRGTMIIALSVNRPRGCCGVGSKLINKAIRHKLRQRRAKNWRKLQLQQGAI